MLPGGYPHVAAEAAGVVAPPIYEMAAARPFGRANPYHGFAAAVREAAAQARLRAENVIFDKRPLDWLKCGPGKETARRPGWSAAPRALPARSAQGNVLADPALQVVFAQLLKAITPYPEARTAMERIPFLARCRLHRPQDDDL